MRIARYADTKRASQYDHPFALHKFSVAAWWRPRSYPNWRRSKLSAVSDFMLNTLDKGFSKFLSPLLDAKRYEEVVLKCTCDKVSRGIMGGLRQTATSTSHIAVGFLCIPHAGIVFWQHVQLLQTFLTYLSVLFKVESL